MMLRLEVFKSKFKETVPSPSSVEHVEKTKAWVQQEGSGAHPWPWPGPWSSEMTCPPLSLALKELRYVYCNVLKGFYSFQVWWFYGQTLAHHLVVWLVEAWTGLWVAVAQLSCRTPNETNRNWIEFKCLMDVIRHCFQVILLLTKKRKMATSHGAAVRGWVLPGCCCSRGDRPATTCHPPRWQSGGRRPCERLQLHPCTERRDPH